MFYLIDFIGFCKHAYTKFDVGNMFQASWGKGKKRLGQLWSAQKHLLGAFDR